MTRPFWVIEAATKFWRKTGCVGPVAGSDIEDAILVTLPQLPIVAIAGLSMAAIRADIRRRNIAHPLPETPAFAIRGCLTARHGKGFAYVEANDTFAEKRFTIAHELAHFLRDHQQIRERAERLLGQRGLAIIDGDATATTHDEIAALIRGVWLRPCFHLMDRDPAARQAIDRVEADADLLALEILAPLHELEPFLALRPDIAELAEHFQLPSWAAKRLLEEASPVESPRMRRLAALFSAKSE